MAAVSIGISSSSFFFGSSFFTGALAGAAAFLSAGFLS